MIKRLLHGLLHIATHTFFKFNKRARYIIINVYTNINNIKTREEFVIKLHLIKR